VLTFTSSDFIYYFTVYSRVFFIESEFKYVITNIIIEWVFPDL
jgi:hypothetical protein